MDWITALTNFQLVVEYKSFSAAAKQRYASSSALSKQIKWLENQFQVELLHRDTRQMKLTEAGMILYEKSKDILLQFQHLKDDIQEMHGLITGKLRVTVPQTYGETVLANHLANFTAKYPAIELEILFENSYIDIIHNHIDIAIRVNKDHQKSLKYILIGKHQIGAFASPHYLKISPLISTPLDLAHQRCLAHSDFNPPHIWKFDNHSVTIKPQLLTNNLNTLINAAVTDQGIIYLSEYVVEKQLKKKELQSVLKKYWQPPLNYYLVYPRQNLIPEKTRLFIEYIVSV